MKVGVVGNENSFLKNSSTMNYQKKDSIKEGLQNQILNIQKQISSIFENKTLSEEQKKVMQKELKEKIDELNKQMMERELEIRKQQEEKQEEKVKEQLKIDNSNGSNQDEMIDLFRVTNDLSKVKQQRATSVKIKGNTRILESEIKLDESRGLDVSKKRKQLSEMKKRIENIDKKTTETMGNINSEMKRGVKKAVKEDKVESEGNRVKEKAGNKKDQENLDLTHIDKRV